MGTLCVSVPPSSSLGPLGPALAPPALWPPAASWLQGCCIYQSQSAWNTTQLGGGRRARLHEYFEPTAADVETRCRDDGGEIHRGSRETHCSFALARGSSGATPAFLYVVLLCCLKAWFEGSLIVNQDFRRDSHCPIPILPFSFPAFSPEFSLSLRLMFVLLQWMARKTSVVDYFSCLMRPGPESWLPAMHCLDSFPQAV